MSGDVIRLVTAAERSRAEQEAYAEAAHAEAVTMLERALEMARERPFASIAIAFAYPGGSYGSLVPLAGDNMGLLAGSIADMAYRLAKENDR